MNMSIVTHLKYLNPVKMIVELREWNYSSDILWLQSLWSIHMCLLHTHKDIWFHYEKIKNPKRSPPHWGGLRGRKKLRGLTIKLISIKHLSNKDDSYVTETISPTIQITEKKLNIYVKIWPSMKRYYDNF